jgi:hypothetical protein
MWQTAPLYSARDFVMAPCIETGRTTQATDRRGLIENPRPPAAETKPQQETQIPTKTMKLARLIAPALIGSSLTLAWSAAAADAPTVDSILARHIEGVGGKEALEKVHSRRIQFKVESETMGNSEGDLRPDPGPAEVAH